MKSKSYDYYLIVLTMVILFAIGLVCFYGISYYNYLATTPGWTGTTGYLQFIDDMNSYLYPFLVLLLISLGLCIPKRLFEQDKLVKMSVLALGVTVILTFFWGIENALGFILAVITGIQGVVLIYTFNKSKAIRFEKEGYLVRMGSSMLHMGIVILMFNFVTLRENQFHILIFWVATLFFTAGNLFSFYPERINSLLKR
jgi:hypothetical protein